MWAQISEVLKRAFQIGVPPYQAPVDMRSDKPPSRLCNFWWRRQLPRIGS